MSRCGLRSSSIDHSVRHKKHLRRRQRRRWRSRNRRSVTTFKRHYGIDAQIRKWSEIRSMNNTVEVLVVFDKRVIEHHGREHIETYILTIMNIVSKLYEDPTLGNRVKVVVVRLIALLEDQPDLTLVHHAERTLSSFCKWQHEINNIDGNKPGVAHHDNAVLLTGHDFCSGHNRPCGTLGLAGVQGMCDMERSCNINEDIGLASGFIVAHEMGHNFGMQHDGDAERGTTKCKTMEKPQLMAPQINSGAYPFTWSSCSRKSITNFLDSGAGSCLLNHPPKPEELASQMRGFPGEVHDADAQCRFIFGEASRHCVYGNICSQLYCYQTNKKCSTNSMPAAQGTICRVQTARDGTPTQGWCYKGECVPAGWRPRPVDGEWGHWNHWSECTKTCGIGVAFQSRQCDAPRPVHGGKYCLGVRRRYRTCNTEECSKRPSQFRAEQCAKFNNSPFQNHYYNWVPYTKGKQTSPCALACKPKSRQWYSELAPHVIDGTRCYDDGESTDVCIRGKCHRVGCDRDLDETRKFDYCMKCGGDNSGCELFTDSFNEPNPNCRDDDDIDDGDDVGGGDKEKKDARQKQQQQRNRGRLHRKHAQKMRLESQGKCGNETTTIFQVPSGATHLTLSQNATANNFILIDRKYKGYSNRPIVTVNTMDHCLSRSCTKEVIYDEDTDSFFTLLPLPQSDSSAWNITCNGPIKMPIDIKIDEIADVRITFYTPRKRDPNELEKYHWTYDNWTPCTMSCGGGIQEKRAICERIEDNEEVSPGLCNPDQRKEDISQSCKSAPCLPEWIADQWSDCSRTCGGGYRQRDVHCTQLITNEPHYRTNRSDAICEQSGAIKPTSIIQNCNTKLCPPIWIAGEWGRCPCGRGWSHRQITCMNWQSTKVLPPEQCAAAAKPRKTKRCHKHCPKPQWKYGKWSECSVRCGHGTRTRKVTCRGSDRRISNQCNPELKPPTTQHCRGTQCHDEGSRSGGESPDSEKEDTCVDINKVAYCPLVHKFNFCNRAYFRKMCCKTCRQLKAAAAANGS